MGVSCKQSGFGSRRWDGERRGGCNAPSGLGNSHGIGWPYLGHAVAITARLWSERPVREGAIGLKTGHLRVRSTQACSSTYVGSFEGRIQHDNFYHE